MARFEGFMPAVYEAQRLLSLNNRELGDYLGVSKRTVQRWLVAGAGPTPVHLQRLAEGVATLDPALAQRLNAAANVGFEALGLPAAPLVAAAATTRASATVARADVDAVLIAAANAVDLSPRAVAPALAAALRRALELRVDPASLLPLLDAATKPGDPRP